MRPGKVSARRWRRTVLAVVVMTLASFSSVRLFINGPSDGEQENTANEDTGVAGRQDNFLPDEPEVVNLAPEPIIISVTPERTGSVYSYLVEAGLVEAEARRWSLAIKTV